MSLRLVRGSAVEGLLSKAIQRPNDYAVVTVSSAFLDEMGVELLEQLLNQGRIGRLDVRVYLGPAAYRSATLGIKQKSHVVRSLHAKVYALEGRHAAEDDLIVTSANLTRAGLRANLEIGIRLSGSSELTRRIMREARATMDTAVQQAKRTVCEKGPKRHLSLPSSRSRNGNRVTQERNK